MVNWWPRKWQALVSLEPRLRREDVPEIQTRCLHAVAVTTISPATTPGATPLGNAAYKCSTIAGITTTDGVATWWADVHVHLAPDSSLNLDDQDANVLTIFIPVP